MVKRIVDEALDERIRSGAFRTPDRIHRAPERTRLQEEERTPRAPDHTPEARGAPSEKRTDGLAWGERRLHRLSDDKIGIEEVKMLWRLEPRPTFTEIGRLLGGYSRDSISAKVKELIALGELEK